MCDRRSETRRYPGSLITDEVDWEFVGSPNLKATALDTGEEFESEWTHVFTVQNGKVTRWRGFFNTAARYGM